MAEKLRDALSGRLSRLGLGCSRLGSFGTEAPLAQQVATVELALDLGLTVFDTANVYAQGDSERLLGKVLRRRREEVVVITKLGKLFSRRMRVLRPFKSVISPLLRRFGSAARVTAARDNHIGSNFDPSRFGVELDQSLRRLDFDHVDAILLHSPTVHEIGRLGISESLDQLVRSGKARCFGVSCDSTDAVDAALRLTGISILEIPFSLLRSEPAVRARTAGIVILGREVIRQQPHLAPTAAIRGALSLNAMDCLLVGATRPHRLRQLVESASS